MLPLFAPIRSMKKSIPVAEEAASVAVEVASAAEAASVEDVSEEEVSVAVVPRHGGDVNRIIEITK